MDFCRTICTSQAITIGLPFLCTASTFSLTSISYVKAPVPCQVEIHYEHTTHAHMHTNIPTCGHNRLNSLNSVPARLDSVNTFTSSRQQSSLNSMCCCKEEVGWTTSSLGGDTKASSVRDWVVSGGREMKDSSRDRHSAHVSESSTWRPFRRESKLKLGDWLLDSKWGLFKLPWFGKKMHIIQLLCNSGCHEIC